MKVMMWLFFAVISQAGSKEIESSLDAALDDVMRKSDLPGFSVAIVGKEHTLFEAGYGYADVDEKRFFDENTVINIGSISKTVISLLLMDLVEKSLIGLDDPINRYLPFKVIHPQFPKHDITIRQLATHTSSLTDGKDDMVIEYSYLFSEKIDQKAVLPEGYQPYVDIYRNNQPMAMADFLQTSYCPVGAWYNKHNFLPTAPGTRYQYTNIGSTLLAYLIEQVSGQKYSKLTVDRVFKPLHMYNTYWHFRDVPKANLGSLYLSNGTKIPHYELITYPDGGLMTSISDFSKYLREMINGAKGHGTLINADSYQQVFGNQLNKENFPEGEFKRTRGLNWIVNEFGDNISMNGADPGILTYTMFTTAGDVGIAIFINSNLDDVERHEETFDAIRSNLFKYAGPLMKAAKEETVD